MKLLVLSDSHGYKRTLFNMILDHSDADAIIFLGDGEQDFKDSIASCSLVSDKIICQVKGNCDHTSHEPEEIIREFNGVRFLITHGHNLKVKYGLGKLTEEAIKKGCQAALFGHTHRRFYEERDGIVLINPGSAGQGSYCIVQVQDGTVQIVEQ